MIYQKEVLRIVSIVNQMKKEMVFYVKNVKLIIF